jgi:hypothetical protein
MPSANTQAINSICGRNVLSLCEEAYSLIIKDRMWHEVGDSIAPGKTPVRIFEMNLRRIGDSTWPARALSRQNRILSVKL